MQELETEKRKKGLGWARTGAQNIGDGVLSRWRSEIPWYFSELPRYAAQAHSGSRKLPHPNDDTTMLLLARRFQVFTTIFVDVDSIKTLFTFNPGPSTLSRRIFLDFALPVRFPLHILVNWTSILANEIVV